MAQYLFSEQYNTPRNTVPFDEIRLEYFEPAILEGIRLHKQENRRDNGQCSYPKFYQHHRSLRTFGTVARPRCHRVRQPAQCRDQRRDANLGPEADSADRPAYERHQPERETVCPYKKPSTNNMPRPGKSDTGAKATVAGNLLQLHEKRSEPVAGSQRRVPPSERRREHGRAQVRRAQPEGDQRIQTAHNRQERPERLARQHRRSRRRDSPRTRP